MANDTELADVITRAVEMLARFTVPLFINHDRPVHVGTGFFVTVGSDCFLVSAAHVLDVGADSTMYFYIAPHETRRLDGRMIRRKAQHRASDVIDVGVVRLGAAARPPFPAVDKYAMDISYLKPNYRPREGKEYVIVGYPNRKVRLRVHEKNVQVTPYGYKSPSVAEQDYGKHGVTAETHVLLPLDLEVGFDMTGRHVNIPKPQGMSGAPVVVLYGDAAEDSRVFPVVAVGIEYRRAEKILLATDVGFVLEAIHAVA